jgi:hypothetical protein
MKLLLLAAALLVPCAAAAQARPTPKLPSANSPSHVDPDGNAVLVPVNALCAALRPATPRRCCGMCIPTGA